MNNKVDLKRWQRHLEEIERQGMTVARYAREQGLPKHTLYAARAMQRTGEAKQTTRKRTMTQASQAGQTRTTNGFTAVKLIASAGMLPPLRPAATQGWAHARRRFVEALAVLPKAQRTPIQPAAQFIAAIAELYAVEARARDLPPVERRSMRDLHSRPVLGRIAALAQTHQHAVLPASLLGKAIPLPARSVAEVDPLCRRWPFPHR